ITKVFPPRQARFHVVAVRTFRIVDTGMSTGLPIRLSKRSELLVSVTLPLPATFGREPVPPEYDPFSGPRTAPGAIKCGGASGARRLLRRRIAGLPNTRNT